MKKTVNLGFIISIILMIIGLSSCKGTSSTSNDSETSISEYDNASSIIPEIVVKFPYPDHDYNTFRKGSNTLHIVFKDKNNSYVKFSNDADYIELAQEVNFLQSVMHKWYDQHVDEWADTETLFKETSKLNSNSGEAVPFEKKFVRESFDRFMTGDFKNILQKLPVYVRAYLNGDKDNIPHDIYQVIDEIYWNEHPQDTYFDYGSYGYNYKSYRGPDRLYGRYYLSAFAGPTEERKSSPMLFFNGDTVPAGLLQMSVFLQPKV